MAIKLGLILWRGRLRKYSMSSPRRLELIFTRDFSHWINEHIRSAYVTEFPKLWGRGLEDQIVHFTGRTTSWYRYADDYEALAKYICHKPTEDLIFSEELHAKFRQEVDFLRTCIKLPPSSILNPVEHVRTLTEHFTLMYPWYTLSVFLAGVWREEFLQANGEVGQVIIDRIFQSRVYSEGLVKLTDLHLRSWLEPSLVQHGYPAHYIKILTVEEIEKLVEFNELPKQALLDERAKGFVFFGGQIIPTESLSEFTQENNLYFPKLDVQSANETKGTVACPGPERIHGTAQVILNSEEVKNFIAGSILVTSMTSPEYLSAMKTASAIITDEGGLTCHAAIIARELGVPCIIGTKNATKIFVDGDLVAVNAQLGTIKKVF